jgi:hypothetical protein
MFLGVDGLPTETKHHSEATPTGSQKAVNSHATEDKHESTDRHVTKKPIKSEENIREGTAKQEHAQKETEGNATEKSTGTNLTNHHSHRSNASISKEQKAENLSLLRDINDLALPSDLNSTSEVLKRNSVIRVFAVDPKSIDKPVEISVQSYTPPPNASAVIEVRPKAFDNYQIHIKNHPDASSWSGYQLQPQETNGMQNWYLGQYQSGLSYIPTEEFLHTQSFSNNPTFYSQFSNQYPVQEATYGNPATSLRLSPPNRAQEISSTFLHNQRISSQPEQNYQSNYAINQPAQNSAYRTDTPQPIQYFLPQINTLPYFLPYPNEILNAVPTNIVPELNNYYPGVLKYVTNSYRLKTHPKLEWVPL